MDEKGFPIGKLQKFRRIFTRESLHEQGTLLGIRQDHNREWLTMWLVSVLMAPAIAGSSLQGGLGRLAMHVT